jgi:hypothetical protein
MQADDTKEIRMYFNTPQLVAFKVNANVSASKWGRATGKTRGFLAPRIIRCMNSMPRSLGAFGGPSYAKLLSHILPEMLLAFEAYGLHRDVDFVLGKKPPSGWTKCIGHPEKYDNHFTLKNGSGFDLLGFDYSTNLNGRSIQWCALDECKKLPYERVQKETLPALRGSYMLFKDKPEYLSLTLASDGNIGKYDHNWIESYKTKASKREDILRIIALADYISVCTDENEKKLLSQELHKLQQNAVFYLEAGTIENLPVLGYKYFHNQAQTLDPAEFMESILNVTIAKVTGAFYGGLDDDHHIYEPLPNYNYINRIGTEAFVYERDCEGDTDHRHDLPLKLSIDLGAHYNWFVVNQLYNDTYYCIKAFHVRAPAKFQDGVDQFCRYYSKHKRKVVELYYDIQANKANTRSTQTDSKVIIDRLASHGWQVVDKCKDKQYISHYIKHRIWNEVLNESEIAPRDERFKHFKINYINAKLVYISMAKAKVKEGQRVEIQKDKKSETDKNTLPEEATHYSDAQDNIVCFDHLELMGNRLQFTF